MRCRGRFVQGPHEIRSGWLLQVNHKFATALGGQTGNPAGTELTQRNHAARFLQAPILDAPEFGRGPHTLAEIRTSCAHVESLGKIEHFETWAKFAMKDARNLNTGRYDVGCGWIPMILMRCSQLVPADAARRIEMPDPRNCHF